MKTWEKIVVIIAIILIGYVAGCFFEINAHNKSDCKYSDWNIFAHGMEWGKSVYEKDFIRFDDIQYIEETDEGWLIVDISGNAYAIN